MEDKKSSIFNVIAIIEAVCGIVGGWICGNAFRVVERSFNTGLMFEIWALTAVGAILLFAIATIIKNQEDTIEKQERIRSELRNLSLFIQNQNQNQNK